MPNIELNKSLTTVTQLVNHKGGDLDKLDDICRINIILPNASHPCISMPLLLRSLV